MSTKDNWDDSSDDEGDAPPDPLFRDAPPDPLFRDATHDDPLFRDATPDPLFRDSPHDPLYLAKDEYHEVQFVEHSNQVEEETSDAKESDVGMLEEPIGIVEMESEADDDDPFSADEEYEDELDNYDKKLGRYVRF